MFGKTNCTCVMNLGEALFASETNETDAMQDYVDPSSRTKNSAQPTTEPRHPLARCPESGTHGHLAVSIDSEQRAHAYRKTVHKIISHNGHWSDVPMKSCPWQRIRIYLNIGIEAARDPSYPQACLCKGGPRA